MKSVCLTTMLAGSRQSCQQRDQRRGPSEGQRKRIDGTDDDEKYSPLGFPPAAFTVNRKVSDHVSVTLHCRSELSGMHRHLKAHAAEPFGRRKLCFALK